VASAEAKTRLNSPDEKAMIESGRQEGWCKSLALKRNLILAEIITAILNGQANEAVKFIKAGINISMSAEEILQWAIIPATKQVTDTFQGADFFIPDVLLASRAIKAGLKAIKPLPRHSARTQRIVLGTVEGDIHDIGKNLVALFLEFAGFEVIDLGVDVTVVAFLQALREHKPDVLAMSALLTTTMGSMSNVIERLHAHHLRDTVKVLVGGGPVTREFAAYIGADAYGENPQETIEIIHELFKIKSS
jgi:methanogenic corrinoid protein MtbC1